MNIFTPYLCYITGITLGRTTLLTFSSIHAFVVGEIISLRVSPPYGTVELNNQQVKVLTVPTNVSVTVDIDSTNFTPFNYPVSGKNTPPCAVPSSSSIVPNTMFAATILNDVFDNVPS